MNPQEIAQAKVISLNVASGNLDNAKLIFNWILEDTVATLVAAGIAKATVAA